MKPYVVSADIHLLLKKWCIEKQLQLPSEDFFQNIRSEWSEYMGTIFSSFEMISEEEINLGMKEIVSKTDCDPLSIDDVYCVGTYAIDITRKVNSNYVDMGLCRRPGTPVLYYQFHKLQSLGVKEVVLIDDVIFSGELICRIIKVLRNFGISVQRVCCGVGIEYGVRRIRSMGYKVDCVRLYKDVIDEVCERDFFPGVPKSGRVLSETENIGIPYVLPFGDLEKWASIPFGQSKALSLFCLEKTIEIFSEIEKCSNKIIQCTDLDRFVVGLPTNNSSFVEKLIQSHSELM